MKKEVCDDLPKRLSANDVELVLNIGINFRFAFQSETLTQQTNAELVPVRVVRNLLNKFLPDTRHRVHHSTVYFVIGMSPWWTLADGCSLGPSLIQLWCRVFRDPESVLCCTAAHHHINTGNNFTGSCKKAAITGCAVVPALC